MGPVPLTELQLGAKPGLSQLRSHAAMQPKNKLSTPSPQEVFRLPPSRILLPIERAFMECPHVQVTLSDTASGCIFRGFLFLQVGLSRGTADLGAKPCSSMHGSSI
jgi:hypothetical protein